MTEHEEKEEDRAGDQTCSFTPHFPSKKERQTWRRRKEGKKEEAKKTFRGQLPFPSKNMIFSKLRGASERARARVVFGTGRRMKGARSISRNIDLSVLFSSAEDGFLCFRPRSRHTSSQGVCVLSLLCVGVRGGTSSSSLCCGERIWRL